MKHLILGLILGLFPLLSSAEGLGLVVNGKSIHFEGDGWNEENWGLGLQYDFPRQGSWTPFLNAGGYLDSLHNNSYYAGGGYRYRIDSLSREDDSLRLEVGASAFVMTREDHLNNRPFLGALPVITLGTRQVDVNMTYIPRVHPKMVDLVFFQAVIRLDGW